LFGVTDPECPFRIVRLVVNAVYPELGRRCQ
jgi:hypothetical protein